MSSTGAPGKLDSGGGRSERDTAFATRKRSSVE
eukprot:COSAG03_NODE_14551_length_460_cov_0.814404_1_plen_32_part_10